MIIKPGLNIRIVTDIDLTKERIHVRSSIIYDTKGSTITIAQTDPPVLKSTLRKEVVITYLVHDKKGPVRYGFPALVTGFVDNYKLSSSNEVRAVTVSRRTEAQPYSIRMFYRVEPTGKSKLSMTIYDKEVNLLDVSLGGARFSHDKRLNLEDNAMVEAYINVDGATHVLEGRILRVWDGENERFRGELGFAAIEFVNMNKALEHALSRKIREIERESRFNEVFP